MGSSGSWHVHHYPPLSELTGRLRRNEGELTTYFEQFCRRFREREPRIRAFVSTSDLCECPDKRASELHERCSGPEGNLSLYGVPVGIKDNTRVDGFPTLYGSDLPPELFDGPEATVVSRLRESGAVIAGKTVTNELAHFPPGPTRNPRDYAHTPGGSSSGSAAAVAAGLCPLALGTQTSSSVIRPAAFCGCVGFKPSFDRLPTDGVLPVAESLDHVGLFTSRVFDIDTAMTALCDDWGGVETNGLSRKLTLGMPAEPYLSQASETGRRHFQAWIAQLEEAGHEIKRTQALSDIDRINDWQATLSYTERALSHHEWFRDYPDRFSSIVAEDVRKGQQTSVGELAEVRANQATVREQLAAAMEKNDVDLWISPAAPGPAPEGLENVGDPVMSQPWTYTGVPTVSIPVDVTDDGLPLGVRCAGRFETDERLLALSQEIERVFKDG